MLNPRTKRIILSRDVTWLNKTYGKYVSRKETIKATSYILQDEDYFNNWSYIKIHPIKTEFNTENVKNEQNVNTKEYSRVGEDIQNTMKTIYFKKQ